MLLKLKTLSFMVLIAFALYFMFERCGFMDDFDIDVGTSTEIKGFETIEIVNASFLKDSSSKKFKIYSGVMKKSALDGWDYLGESSFEFPSENINSMLELVDHAEGLGANVIIVDSRKYRRIRRSD